MVSIYRGYQVPEQAKLPGALDSFSLEFFKTSTGHSVRGIPGIGGSFDSGNIGPGGLIAGSGGGSSPEKDS